MSVEKILLRRSSCESLSYLQDFQCSIRIKPLIMGSLDAYAYYEMAITNDERRTAYFADRLSEAGCAMYP